MQRTTIAASDLGSHNGSTLVRHLGGTAHNLGIYSNGTLVFPKFSMRHHVHYIICASWMILANLNNNTDRSSVSIDTHATRVGRNTAQHVAATQSCKKSAAKIRGCFAYVVSDNDSQCHSTSRTSHFLGQSNIKECNLAPFGSHVPSAAAVTTRPLQNASMPQ